jgi:hypothetical protein
MNLRNFASKGTEKVLVFGIDAVKPINAIKYVEREIHASDEIDTQELAEKAARIIDTDPSREVFARCVMIELDSGSITPEQAAYYLTPPNERV